MQTVMGSTMAAPLREWVCWTLLALASARLLLPDVTLSAEQLLTLGWRTALPLAACLLLYKALVIYSVPMNHVMGPHSLGPVRDESTKNLWNRQRATKNHVNQVRQRQKNARMPPPYPNAWFMAMESRDLRPGEVRPLDILGYHLVIFRTKAGEARILDGICPHLGADLAMGVVKGEDIECPFHKWAFNGLTGEVECVPYSKQNKGSLQHFAVDAWPVFEANGAIHVWHHAEGEPPSWHPPIHPHIASGRYKFCGRSEHTVFAHIQDLPENGADNAHLAVLHGKIFTDGNDLEERLRWRWIRHNWTATWEAHPEQKHRFTTRISTSFTVLNMFHDLYHNDVVVEQVGPGLVYIEFNAPFGSGVVQQMVTPVGDLCQRVVHTIYWDRSYGLGPLIAKFTFLAEVTQFERDVRMWNSKDHLPLPALVREDATILKYRRWFSQFYSENSRRPLRPVDSLEL
ncbi:LOW QUALITY PROTEIN: cholesterol 7-desaturase-like [Pollicipes pollicipes]|uniref:LOW QUALITY PROTEIN: cholesterol 7-desaturase-like n=1 Tax=Pollicipes pollicipes TaxID=41117 RepID=UPI001885567C|nr:LOW QUALITY PROTEIN: cholesterol 7-desaturase-like [Pollicipes pollicipes]